MIKSLVDVIKQKDREVLSLKLTIQELEKRTDMNSSDLRYGEELNRLQEQNMRFKVLLMDYEKERKYLEKVNAD